MTSKYVSEHTLLDTLLVKQPLHEKVAYSCLPRTKRLNTQWPI